MSAGRTEVCEEVLATYYQRNADYGQYYSIFGEYSVDLHSTDYNEYVFTFRLLFCGITETGCGHLATALKANPSHLKELDLSYNHPGQTGEELLSCLQRDIEHLTVR